MGFKDEVLTAGHPCRYAHERCFGVMDSPASPAPRAHFVLACNLLIAALGLLTIMGWVFDVEVLASVRREYIPMAPSTALAFAGLGVAMIVRSWGLSGRRAALVLVAAVALLAGAKLIEFLFGTSFGIDESLIAEPAAFGAVRKGRMSPITAVLFLFSCGGFLFRSSSRLRVWSGVPTTALFGVTSVILLGYLHGTPILYGGSVIPVALPTAVAFLLISLSLIAQGGATIWPVRAFIGESARALLLRWFLPPVIVVAAAGGIVRTQFLQTTTLNPAVLSAVSTVVIVAAIGLLISEVAKIVGGRIDRAEVAQAAAQAELEALNQVLEQRIATRTLELQTKNEQMEEELKMARELQLAMLPSQFPSLPRDALPGESAVRFFTFYFPTGGVSGDFFNIFPVSETSVGIFICDVMGHGVRAALVTSMMRALMEQHAGQRYDPGELLTRLNRGLLSILSHAGTRLYATASVVVADVALTELVYANAGHPKPFHCRRADGQAVRLDEAKGPALGLFEGTEYTTARVRIAPGDGLILFTDGLFEVEDPRGTFYSQEALLATVNRHSARPMVELLDAVLAEVRDFSGRTDFDDDVCVIGMEVAASASLSTERPAGAKGSEDFLRSSVNSVA
jgi:serine phosphatase RsbU (regulator of sigma subunit)